MFLSLFGKSRNGKFIYSLVKNILLFGIIKFSKEKKLHSFQNLSLGLIFEIFVKFRSRNSVCGSVKTVLIDNNSPTSKFF